ncbi:TonB-dependent outermembrane ferripyoverdine receptor [Pseudomonas sp. StFLB209]|uniref:TonB-dependent siderophore receptor n=1 Tax=Pseudomonas sp. StFLB209 TaxID=1028989 RepID=UPI0004F84316|nr:TonB-dependent siderophore receptor [Pseudomonas sp. StFLB209]BAP43385.1 TonB-dependent outermembrane ferripyoverdine receptor [Pseudomonas sp. StFLB209]
MGNNGSSPRLSQRLSLLAAALLMAGTAMAQDTAYQLDIAPQALDQALNALAGQTGSRILFATDIAEGRQAQGLKASLTVEQALQRLVSGSGLQVQKTGDGSYLVSRPEGGGALEISSVDISGKAPGSITEGTGSYTTYATSSATRLNLSPKDTPQSITVLTSQRLEDQRLENLEDVLEATPGISVLHVTGYGTDSATISSRGSTVNSFQIDGVQTSSTLQTYLQNTAIYDRVEVVRGATGLMNSLGSPAATVNMVRKRPTYEPQVSLTAEAGNWSRYGSSADISGPLTETGNIRGRAVLDYKRQGSWVDNYKQDSYTFYGIGEADLNDSTLLTFGASHITRDTDAPMNRIPLFYGTGQRFDFDPSDTVSPSWSYYDHELSNVFASVEHHFNSNWSGKAELNYTEHRSDSLYGAFGTVARPGAGSNISSLLRYQPTSRQSTFDSYLTGKFSLFGREHELISGITLSDLQSKAPTYNATYSTGSYYVADYFDLENTLPKPDNITKTGKTVTNETQQSAYLSARFSLSDATSLLLGGRVTDWKRDVDSTTFSSGVKSERLNKKTGLFVPYAGLVHALDDNWSVYASYTKIFNPQLARYLDINNSPLDPEEGISYEVGIKSSFNEGRINASLSLYKTELDNRAYWYTLGNRTIYDTESGTETKGVELEFNGELTEGWQVGAGYSYNDIRDANDARLMTYVPQHIAKTFTTYKLSGALNKLTIGGGMDWSSKVENLGFTQGSYALANLMARYQVNSNLSVSVNVNNIFDREYLTSYSTWGTYGPPRNFMTSIKYSY